MDFAFVMHSLVDRPAHKHTHSVGKNRIERKLNQKHLNVENISFHFISFEHLE